MKLAFMVALIAATAASMAATQPVALPKPVLQLKALERYSAGGYEWVRHTYEVTNRAAFPAEMFAAAPDLPPCGLNRKSSRSWVDFFDAKGKRLYGFCALETPDDLGRIWFATPLGAIAPARVYVEITDRKTSVKYRSNLVETSFGPARLIPPQPKLSKAARSRTAPHR